MLFQKFKYFGINLVDPTTFEVINVVFLRKSVVNELPRKITMFFYVRCVTSKIFSLRKIASFLGATPSKHVPFLDLHKQQAMADFGKTQYEYVTGELQTLTLLSPLNRNQHDGHAKLCGVENMTNTQNKLLNFFYVFLTVHHNKMLHLEHGFVWC